MVLHREREMLYVEKRNAHNYTLTHWFELHQICLGMRAIFGPQHCCSLKRVWRFAAEQKQGLGS